ncbi:MAG TPA: ribonuclease HII [Geobacteraceae bacterium]|nr:ribonuclease HII [Geobacteraceae bacterium]
MWEFEDLARSRGFNAIAGVDEAGRGPLAGPVVAAAVILSSSVDIPGINDSKKLTASVRDALFERICAEAVAVGVGVCDSCTVDRINILQATLRAMEEAVGRLQVPADYLLIDGISRTASHLPQKIIKKGDSLSISIAAASIVAKVTRDRMMLEYDQLYPEYGFAGHKGYGSASHLAVIANRGPSPIHRLTFRGVREHVRSSTGDGAETAFQDGTATPSR